MSFKSKLRGVGKEDRYSFAMMKHAQRRAMQRYDLLLSDKDYRHLCQCIINPSQDKDILIHKFFEQERGRSVYSITIGNKFMIVIFSKNKKAIVTFLPQKNYVEIYNKIINGIALSDEEIQINRAKVSVETEAKENVFDEKLIENVINEVKEDEKKSIAFNFVEPETGIVKKSGPVRVAHIPWQFRIDEKDVRELQGEKINWCDVWNDANIKFVYVGE